MTLADIPEPLAHLEPADISRTVRLIGAMTAADELEVGRVAVELRADPRGPDASIILLAAMTTLVVALLKEAGANE